MRKKIFYVPGSISSIGLMVVLLFYLYRTPDYQRPHVLRLFVPSDRPDPRGFLGFSKYSVLRSLKGKTVHAVDLDEEPPSYDPLRYRQKQGFIVREIEQMEFMPDSTTVLKVHFGGNNTYGDFVWLLDQAVKYRCKRYAWFDDDFYFLDGAAPRAGAPPPVNPPLDL